MDDTQRIAGLETAVGKLRDDVTLIKVQLLEQKEDPGEPPTLKVRLNDDNSIDEVFLHGVRVHVEQMAGDAWWVGLSWEDKLVHLNFVRRKKRIRLQVTNEGFSAQVVKGDELATSPDYEQLS